MLDWVVQHPQLAGMAVFLMSAAESLAVVGLFIPGTVVMFGVGALVGKGALGLWPTLAWAAAGAVLGDGLSYWLGYRYRERLCDVWPFSRHPSLLQKGETFFLLHGGKSVLLGRFVGPVRPVIPVVAGMLGMPPARFYLVNILSALTWAPAYILPGVVFGAALSLAAAVSMRLALLIVVLVVSLWLVVAGTHLAATRLKPRLARIWVRLDRWLTTPARSEFATLALFAMLLIAGAWVFIAVLEDVFTRDWLIRVDSLVYHFLQGLRTPAGDAAMVALTELGDAAVTVPVVASVLGWLLWSRSWRAAVYWLTAVVCGAGLALAIKAGLQLPRPVSIYQGLSQYGFPSGHAAVSVVVYGFLGVLIGGGVSSRIRVLLASGVILLTLLIAFSRLYLGAHWLSDVLGGLSFGTAWVALLAIAYLRRSGIVMPHRGLAAAALVAFFAAGAWHESAQHARDVERYAPHETLRTMTPLAWWSAGWRSLPAWRIDLEGEDEQPVTFQWAGSWGSLRTVLLEHGWREPVPLAGGNWLLWLDTGRPAARLPVLPNSHDGRNNSQVLIRDLAGNPSRRLVLRLWPAGVQLGGLDRPVWIGTVVQETITQPLGWFALPHADEIYDAPRDALAADLGGIASKLVQRAEPGVSMTGRNLWDRKVLLSRRLR